MENLLGHGKSSTPDQILSIPQQGFASAPVVIETGIIQHMQMPPPQPWVPGGPPQLFMPPAGTMYPIYYPTPAGQVPYGAYPPPSAPVGLQPSPQYYPHDFQDYPQQQYSQQQQKQQQGQQPNLQQLPQVPVQVQYPNNTYIQFPDPFDGSLIDRKRRIRRVTDEDKIDASQEDISESYQNALSATGAEFLQDNHNIKPQLPDEYQKSLYPPRTTSSKRRKKVVENSDYLMGNKQSSRTVSLDNIWFEFVVACGVLC
tara:strand:+ start:199 stop:969 length:771 start_codon:yes stop_codon:yes gene_type:complete